MTAPVVQATLNACLLTTLSNVLAQMISAYRENVKLPHLALCRSASLRIAPTSQWTHLDFIAVLGWFLAEVEPYTLSLTPIIQFITFTVLTCPPNFMYQQLLESIFPSTHLAPSSSAIQAAANNDEKTLGNSTKLVEPKLNKTNTLLKFLIDQIFGASLNTLAFIFLMGSLQGQSWEVLKMRAEQEFVPMMIAGYKLWPMVSLAGYGGLKSVEARQLLGSCAGLGWNVFLSLKAGRGAAAKKTTSVKVDMKEL